jgi:hypothetical protein
MNNKLCKESVSQRSDYPLDPEQGESLLGLQKMVRVEMGTFVGPVRHFQESF